MRGTIWAGSRLCARIPREIRHCLLEIETLGPAMKSACRRWDNVAMFLAYPNVAKKAKQILLAHRDGFAQQIRDGKATPRLTALVLFRKVSGDQVTSGHYHIYRGVLSTIGEGLLGIFDYAEDELVKVEHTDVEAAAKDKAGVRQHIKEMG